MRNYLRTLLDTLIRMLGGTPPTPPTPPPGPQPTSRLRIGGLIENLLFFGLIPLAVWSWVSVQTYGIATAVLAVVYWVVGFVVVKTSERAVKTLFERPYTTCESGLRWVPFLIGGLERRTTRIVELTLPTKAGVFTRQGKAIDAEGNPITNGRDYGPINMTIEVSVLFQYPPDDRLIDAVVKLPRENIELTDLFEEPVLDMVRTTAGDTVWINLVQRRAHFAKLVRGAIISDPDGVVGRLLSETGLDWKFQIALKHVQVPPDVVEALSSQERAELTRAGVLIDADTQRRKSLVEGAGYAGAKRQLLNVIREHPENLQAQALLTLIEMAQGPATTIFPLSTDLTNSLGRVLGRGGVSGDPELDRILSALTPQQRTAALDALRNFLNPTPPGGNP